MSITTKFTHPPLMRLVREQLRHTSPKEMDPLFGSFFHELITLTTEVTPRFSCQGHYAYYALNANEKWEAVTTEIIPDDAVAMFQSDPYISFLCTEKGFDLIRAFYRLLVKRTLALGYNPTVYQLTESYYFDEDDPNSIDGETGRITLRIIPYHDVHFFDRYEAIIELIKTTLKDVLTSKASAVSKGETQ